MDNFPEDFPDADTLIHMLKSNYQGKEVPVNMKNRLSGKSMHSGLKSLYYAIKMLVSRYDPGTTPTTLSFARIEPLTGCSFTT